jgi:predicted enzyme related to lactoylglutathione lyase
MDPAIPRSLRTCIYPVADLAAAKAWYAQAFETTPNFDEPFYVGFTVGGFELGLLPAGDGLAPSTSGAEVLWAVDDIRAAHARLVALGATELSAVADVGGDILVSALRCPFGNRIGLIFNPHFDVGQVR